MTTDEHLDRLHHDLESIIELLQTVVGLLALKD